MNEHFTVEKKGKKAFSYFLCPISKECGGFYEMNHHLICDFCGKQIEDEAIAKGICDDNREK